jgi:sugar lactone lactonase YvrE
MRVLMGLALLVFISACATRAPVPVAVPSWSFSPENVFPADRSLARPEDGVMLADGRLLVADQVHGLRLLHADGRSEPFGRMREAGYDAGIGAANGVAFEPDRSHVLVTDVLAGGIYRVDVASGAAERVHQHPYGVNMARRDRNGAIWFTRSTRNTAADGAARLFGAFDAPLQDGALLRVPAADVGRAVDAEVVLDGIAFANGLALDEARGRLYLAEMAANRIRVLDLDFATGSIEHDAVLVELTMPDNVELDPHGRLWVALPLRNELVAVNTDDGSLHSAFGVIDDEQERGVAEFVRRGAAGEPRMGLFTPAAWAPLPGAVTGVILDLDGVPRYVTGLGDALVRLGD